ncbi:hypothetical protein KCTC52924_03184 [Arenibacter antarcticus]|uniref:DUF2461 domain-containing protein n=1 Tax=Arenibacter antarcticus TaxID=2040469 RepID=A0ABW5VH13_9FLAO|nr:DUF2461 domain-containing protein [Arenibacter sp. H213]MCM4166259.1 TIGR02453 family protein [Arenibacter sp. H213]
MSRTQQEVITKEVLQILDKLENNNTREWFTEHKAAFKEQEATVKNFFKHLMNKLKLHDDIEKLKLFRIYRDVRFSKDKTPYKSHFAASFSRAGVRLRGGYYVQLKPGKSFLAAGFWEPNKEDLLRIRKEFELDSSEIRAIINDKGLKDVWGEMKGDELKLAPMGFDKEHENIDLIKRKQFIFVKNFTDEEVLSDKFMDDINSAFQKIRPYFDYMSEVLTTDLNGESVYD